jgi:hypothetical protein
MRLPGAIQSRPTRRGGAGYLINRGGAIFWICTACCLRLAARALFSFCRWCAAGADRTRAIERTIGVSLDLLDQSERARFSELGIFPEDADIPLGVAGRLWDETGGLNEFETEDVLSRLYDLSLLLNLDLNQRLLRLHDTVRHFLQDQDGKDRLIAQHKRLLLALGDPPWVRNERRLGSHGPW